MSHPLNENLEAGDLHRLIHDEIHIDEYKSKMGDDKDICVISFKVSAKEPAADLVSFVEKGYDWVIDADVSSGEKEGGDYLVFIEADRTPKLPEQICDLLGDLELLTEISTWRVQYYKDPKIHEANEEILTSIIPLTPEQYAKKYEKDVEDDEKEDELSDEELNQINQMKDLAGVPNNTTAPVNEWTTSLRSLAGINHPQK